MKQLVYIGAEWCGPCKALKPLIDNLSAKYDIVRLDADRDKESVTKFSVRSVPTLLLVKDNIAINRLIGTQITEVAVNNMFNS